MHLIREFEVRCMQSYQEKKIGGFCHVYIGQEAVAVGCTAAMKHEDPIVTAYRDHGHGPLPVTEHLSDQTLILPIFHQLDETEVDRIAEVVINAAHGRQRIAA